MAFLRQLQHSQHVLGDGRIHAPQLGRVPPAVLLGVVLGQQEIGDGPRLSRVAFRDLAQAPQRIKRGWFRCPGDCCLGDLGMLSRIMETIQRIPMALQVLAYWKAHVKRGPRYADFDVRRFLLLGMSTTRIQEGIGNE